jgi:signal transduction histidine kinase
MAYRSVRKSISIAAADRLHAAGDRIAALLATSARRSTREAQLVAANSTIRPWISGGSNFAAAQAELNRLARASPATSTMVLTRRDGRQLIAGNIKFAGAHDVIGPEPFFVESDTVRYAMTAPLVEANDTLGRVTTVRFTASANASTSEVLGGLVGQGVTLLVGNSDGRTWTDLTKPAPAPAAVGLVQRGLKDGRVITSETIASIVHVAGTPWLVWVGQPPSVALEAATALVRRLATLAILVVLVGALVAWWLIRRITAPLDDLAVTSEAIARGDYGRRIARTTSTDEIGRVATAFNAMANEVQLNNRALEGQVAERTAALEDAMNELQRAQEEVVRTARLATLGQLAGGVGHELRNPLGVMTNAVYVLETVLPNPDAMVRDYLGILKTQISLSEKIVADLLDFARIKPAARAPVPLFSVVSQQVERLGPLGTTRIEYDFPDALPEADIDGVQIGQVVLNLVANAVQAMGDTGGVVSCRGRHDGNGTLTLDVSDTGPGMPDEIARRVFEPLFTTKARGLGLGLAVSRMLAQNNGGRLTFVSRFGLGTTFTLAVPATHGNA